MARYDVFRRADGAGLVLDCQANILGDLRSRFVVPLLAEADAGRPISRLNPIFAIDAKRYVWSPSSRPLWRFGS